MLIGSVFSFYKMEDGILCLHLFHCLEVRNRKEETPLNKEVQFCLFLQSLASEGGGEAAPCCL